MQNTLTPRNNSFFIEKKRAATGEIQALVYRQVLYRWATEVDQMAGPESQRQYTTMYLNDLYNEGTKVQNPRHLCHVHI